jgi:dolichol-phosphate mannosyltransferase
VVIGSRYVAGGRVVGWSRLRHGVSRLANAYVRAVTGTAVRDATSGFRVWRRRALASLPLDELRSRGYAFQVEMLVAAAAGRLRVEEVPIVFRDRAAGQSKLSLRIVLESLLRPWLLKHAPSPSD